MENNNMTIKMTYTGFNKTFDEIVEEIRDELSDEFDSREEEYGSLEDLVLSWIKDGVLYGSDLHITDMALRDNRDVLEYKVSGSHDDIVVFLGNFTSSDVEVEEAVKSKEYIVK